MLVLQLVIPEKIHIPVPTDRENFHPPGRGRQNVLRCLGGGVCGSKFVQGVTLCKKPMRDLSSKMFVNLI